MAEEPVSATTPTAPLSLTAGFWRLADPRISLASVASMALATAAAARDGAVSLGWLALVVLGILAIEIAKNASGELFDFDSGTDLRIAPEDRSPFSGGKRVLVDGLLTRSQTAAIAAAGYTAGTLIGLVIAEYRQPAVLWFGLAGVACAFFYHAPPVKLSYRGLGEIAVALCYGPLIACGTYLVERGRISADLFVLSLPLGLLIGAFLWINEFPDYRADRSAGKKTLVVRLGPRHAAIGFAAIVATAFGLLLVAPLLAEPLGLWLRVFGAPVEGLRLPRTVWLGMLGLPPALAAAGRVLRDPRTTSGIVPAQGMTLLAFLLMSAGSSLGLLLS
jgi:1,4-dihydroxy-2-naphthoate polyprenyltransferase